MRQQVWQHGIHTVLQEVALGVLFLHMLSSSMALRRSGDEGRQQARYQNCRLLIQCSIALYFLSFIQGAAGLWNRAAQTKQQHGGKFYKRLVLLQAIAQR